MGTKHLFNITLQNYVCRLLLDFVHYQFQDQIMKICQKGHMAIRTLPLFLHGYQTTIPLCSKKFAVVGDFIYKLVAYQ